MVHVKMRQLAKLMKTMLVVQPAEYGLFWDKDGSMPWKEFYWSLQRDEEFRFIQRSHIKEMELLRVELPFMLDSERLVLKGGFKEYPLVDPPESLYVALPLRSLLFVQEKGLSIPSNRSYLPLWDDADYAMTCSKPSNDIKIIITVFSKKIEDHTFYHGGGHLFLTDKPIPVRALAIPFVSAREMESLKEKRMDKKDITHNQVKHRELEQIGSFKVTVEDFQKAVGGTKGKDRSKGSDWKRESRKLRKTKRSI